MTNSVEYFSERSRTVIVSRIPVAVFRGRSRSIAKPPHPSYTISFVVVATNSTARFPVSETRRTSQNGPKTTPRFTRSFTCKPRKFSNYW